MVYAKKIKNETKEQKVGFLSMLLGILWASLLANLLTGKGVKWSNIPESEVKRVGESTVRAGIGAMRAGQDF